MLCKPWLIISNLAGSLGFLEIGEGITSFNCNLLVATISLIWHKAIEIMNPVRTEITLLIKWSERKEILLFIMINFSISKKLEVWVAQ